MNDCLTHGSLFSGIGGFEVGAERAGIKTLWNCEFEKHNRVILKNHFPKTEQYDDIRTMRNPGPVDIISGGFPCQDISVAGKMVGIGGGRSGLWSEMFRIICEVRPRYAIIENSPALLIRGFEKVLSDLSSIGYNAEWQCISNHSFGYPHRRARVYVIAYPHEVGHESKVQGHRGFKSIFSKWAPSPNDGLSMSQRIYELPKSENVRGGDGFRYWTQRVGCLGNAVNPTLAHYLFECIKTHAKRIE